VNKKNKTAEGKRTLTMLLCDWPRCCAVCSSQSLQCAHCSSLFDIVLLWDKNIQHKQMRSSQRYLDAKPNSNFYSHILWIALTIEYPKQVFLN